MEAKWMLPAVRSGNPGFAEQHRFIHNEFKGSPIV